MRRPLVAAVAAALALTGCAKDDLQGDVTAKQVRPGYTYVYMMPMYSTTCSGNPVTCRQVLTGFIPITYSVPECRELTVKGTTSGETCVDPATYDATKVGDYYQGPDVDPRDRKERIR